MLLKLQADLVSYALTKDASDNLLKLIKGDNKLEKLGIYVNNFLSNCINALKIVYPNTIKLVGEEYFDFVAKKFVINNPPQKASMLEYGENFSDFLSGIEQLNSYPFVTDFARLEWLMHLSHHAKTQKPVGIEILNNPELFTKVQLLPTVYTMSSEWDLLEIYNNCQNELNSVEYNFKKGSYILIHRPNWKVELTSIFALEYQFLTSISIGVDLDSLDEHLNAPEALAPILIKILNLKILTL